MARPSTSEIISKVRQIEIKTNRPVEGIISGAYLSAFKGTGNFNILKQLFFNFDQQWQPAGSSK